MKKISVYFFILIFFSLHQWWALFGFLTGRPDNALVNPLKNWNLNISFFVFDRLQGYFVSTRYVTESEHQKSEYLVIAPEVSNIFERSIFRSIEKYGHDQAFIEHSLKYLFCQKNYQYIRTPNELTQPIQKVSYQMTSTKDKQLINENTVDCNF